MLYCKNCGRELKDGARFCDRCGQSVRKTQESSQAAKHREIEELKAERLNRKRRLAEKEEKQAMKKKRKKSGAGVAVFFFVLLLIAVVSVIIGFRMFSGSAPASTAAPKTTASAKSTAAAQTSKPAATQAASNGTYSEITVSNIKIPYPSTFHTNTTSVNEKLNITDSLGGANMIIGQEAKTGEASELIKEYISTIGANNNPKMTAKGDSYSVTAQVGNKIYHRKAIVRNGLETYYDFIYDANSSASKKYDEYINYIDSHFN